ncbi:MAG: SDR family NAD(P)-dependent oxidoreductase [Candidatus Promineifilaceae bacterium]
MTTKIAVITGASSGIGAEFARQLAVQGYDLLLVARRVARLEQVAARLMADYGVSAEIHPTDLADLAQTKALATHLRQLPQVDLLINNAGLGTETAVADSDADKQLTMLHVHIDAPFLLSHAVLPNMIAKQAGAIINVSSIAGFMHGANGANYCASKAYLTSFSESLQLEVREQGIKVQALCPGFTVTEFHDTDWMARFERGKIPERLWDSAEFVVTHSLNHLNRRDPVTIIPGRKNRLIVATAQNKLFDRGRKFAGSIIKPLLRFRG